MKWLLVSNTLAYYSTEQVTAVNKIYETGPCSRFKASKSELNLTQKRFHLHLFKFDAVLQRNGLAYWLISKMNSLNNVSRDQTFE
jgi:hypothetical protein